MACNLRGSDADIASIWEIPGVKQRVRIERDTMGEVQVPADAYYGAHTQRAIENFPISNLRFPRRFIQALGLIKLVSAEVNVELGLLDPRFGAAIARAAREVADGKLDSQFPVDIFQTGSGTSTNMNANEVIAGRANELLEGKKGGKEPVHPNDHVNLGQSSNDVIPTTIHLSALLAIQQELLPAITILRDALLEKSRQLMPVVKTGRTHLQDATPIRLGQEFLGFAGQVERGIRCIESTQRELQEVALGGTAVGTGINTHPEFSRRCCERLSILTGIQIWETDNHFQAQSTIDGAVQFHGVLNGLAVALMKIANDIRWLGSGPRAGIGEIALPAVQPGSSIMPGKVNPVIAESLAMVCAQVMGNHTTITVAGQSGNFELNVMLPIAAYSLLQSIELLASASRNFTERLVVGVEATKRGPEMVERGLAIATGLVSAVGYDMAAEIAKEAARTGRTVRSVAQQKTNLSAKELDRLLDPTAMTQPGHHLGPSSS
jgi:fumarate hydratase class II